MVQIKKDKYVLGQTPVKAVDSAGKKVRADLQLQLATGGGQVISATVSGNVKDSSNANISGALVSIMDNNFQPLIHTITDASGNYTFGTLPISSNYKIFSIASGKQLNQGADFTLASGGTVTRNFTLANETAATQGIIAGDIVKTGTTTPVDGAVISLHVSGAGETMVAVTYTNQFGQYAFREIPTGNYFIQINALGYVPKRVLNTNVATAGQVVNVDVTLDSEAVPANGTASGVITDNEGNPIPRADVVLYSIAADGALTAIGYTKTNSNGVYLFSSVPPGTYRAKSNFMESVEYTFPVISGPRPNVDNLNLSEAQTVVPVTVLMDNVTPAGGATLKTALNGTTKIMDFVGGATPGSLTFTTNVPHAGSYRLAIKYLSNNVRSMLIDVNGANTGTTYSVPAGTGWNESDLKTFNATVTLVAGNNTIKIYGPTGATYAPVIGPVDITNVAESFTRAVADYTLGGGAFVDGSTGFIFALGGGQGGTATLNVNAPAPGRYNCVVTYRGNSDRPMRVDINGVFSASYNVPADLTNTATYTVPVTLNTGNNTIKFYNSDANVNAPDLKGAVLTQALYNDLQEAESATLGGSAAAANGFVSGLGGSGAGSITMTKSVPYAGAYDLSIAYVTTTSGTKLRVWVNGADTGTDINFGTTATLNAADKKTATVRLTLAAGNNTIKVM